MIRTRILLANFGTDRFTYSVTPSFALPVRTPASLGASVSGRDSTLFVHNADRPLCDTPSAASVELGSMLCGAPGRGNGCQHWTDELAF